MKKKIIVLVCFALTGIFLIQSCKQSGCSTSRVSSFNGHESSKMTGNCMSCHAPNGSASGCFSVGGTAFDTTTGAPGTNATVYLFTQPHGGGDLIAIVQVDKSGNFYTTSVINMGNGVYPAIAYQNGEYSYMPNPIFSGECNSCHGVINPAITVK
jgi:hypothetical protein